MERDPSIHVTYTTLVTILQGLGIENPKNTAKRIMQAAVPFNIKDRYIVTGDAQVRKQARRLVSASTIGECISTEAFNRLLTTIRMQEGHRGVIAIRHTDNSQWLLLKEIAQTSSEFSSSHGLDLTEGAKIFIKLGIKLMKRNYSLSKFKYYREQINNLYIAADMVQNDPEAAETTEVYSTWKKLMRKYSNLEYDLTGYEYVNMVYVRMEAQAVNAKYEDWLTAQFEFFTIFNSVPTLPQLITDAARQRYYEYMGSKKKNGKPTQIVNDKTDYKNEFEAKYFESLRATVSDKN